MATLRSTNVNSGDPVTYDIINNIISDLNELNKTTAAKFNLNLTQTGGKDGKDAESKSVYSTVIGGVTVNPKKRLPLAGHGNSQISYLVVHLDAGFK